ncbi:MAG: ParB/Sulfiredoxin domain [Sphingomonadales bacterium]|nr:ParB/Sulfiredoxin domain [Sphingomonadales bacterium]
MDLRNHPHIEIVERGSLKPNSKNARKHSAASIERLARSFDRFGVIDPIIVDEDGLTVAGSASGGLTVGFCRPTGWSTGSPRLPSLASTK